MNRPGATGRPASAWTWRESGAWLGYQWLFGAAFLAGAGAVPWLVRRSVRVATGFREYLGGLPRPPAGPLVWVHGVSLGESLVAFALMEKIRRESPGWRIGFTTTHPDVMTLVQRKKLAEVAGYAPLDAACFVWRALRRWRPRLVVISETDLWPGLAVVARALQVPVVLVNGRISQKHEAFWRRVPGLAAALWSGFRCLGVQSETDRARLLSMGAPASAIKVLGNIKVDLVPARSPEGLAAARQWRGERPLIVLGSLHPSEFEGLLPVIERLVKQEGCRVLVAPRAVTNAVAWAGRLQARGVSVGRRSAVDGWAPTHQVMLLDTVGELAALYALATVAFVGGTLDPVVGGHNPLEVIAHRVPLVVGPHVRNFADLISELREAGGVAVAPEAAAVGTAIAGLMTDPAAAAQQVDQAQAVIARHRGALDRTMALLRPFLSLPTAEQAGGQPVSE